MPNTRAESVRRGLLVGAVVAAVLASGFAFADWLGNPGGIFRGDEGTRWVVVWETFFSWFWPLLLLCLLAAFAFTWRRSRT